MFSHSYLNAFFVPILATAIGEGDIGLRTWVCVLVAVCGNLLLVHDGGEPNVGDAWSCAAALASAMFIVRLTRASRGRSAASLSAASLAFTGLGCWALSATVAQIQGLSVSAEAVRMVSEHAWSLVYLAIVVSAAASYLQAYGQQRVPPHEAAVIYTLDPVYGAAFAYLLLGESLHALGFLGVALVVGANMLRRLPWESWSLSSRLVTPHPSDAALLDPKKVPLLGTPRTPAWMQEWAKRVARANAAGALWR